MSFNINSAIQSRTAVLTGVKNYSQWSRQVRALLTMAGWWSIVEGTSTHAGLADPAAQTTWIGNDQQAQVMIVIYIHSDLQHYQKDRHVPVGNVTHPSMAHDLWVTLHQLYSPTGVTGQYDGFSRAIKFSISDHSRNADDMPNQINHLVNIFNEMSTASLTLPDNLKAMILLNALPHSYKNTTSTIVQTVTMANFTMDHIIPLIISESQLRHATNSRSLIHRLSSRPVEPLPAQANHTNTIQHAPRTNETCTHCGKGHPSDRCWKKYGQPGQQSPHQRGGHSNSNRGRGDFTPHSSGQRQTQNRGGYRGRGSRRGRGNYKGKGRANEVDAIVDSVQTMDPMEVDEEYDIGEGEDLDHQPIFEQWDEDNSDRVFVDGEQIAGPSKPFRARSYSFEL
jgi:hypothetical protein